MSDKVTKAAAKGALAGAADAWSRIPDDEKAVLNAAAEIKMAQMFRDLPTEEADRIAREIGIPAEDVARYRKGYPKGD